MSAIPTPKTVRIDQDLAGQARPGHGIPSQDPDPAAQMPMEPGEAEREANSVLTGGGMMVGAAAGPLADASSPAASDQPAKREDAPAA